MASSSPPLPLPSLPLLSSSPFLSSPLHLSSPLPLSRCPLLLSSPARIASPPSAFLSSPPLPSRLITSSLSSKRHPGGVGGTECGALSVGEGSPAAQLTPPTTGTAARRGQRRVSGSSRLANTCSFIIPLLIESVRGISCAARGGCGRGAHWERLGSDEQLTERRGRQR